MSDVPGCELCSPGQYDSGYLSISHVNRVPITLAFSRQDGGGLGGRTIKIKDASLQVFNYQFVEGCFKRLSASTFR